MHKLLLQSLKRIKIKIIGRVNGVCLYVLLQICKFSLYMSCNIADRFKTLSFYSENARISRIWHFKGSFRQSQGSAAFLTSLYQKWLSLECSGSKEHGPVLKEYQRTYLNIGDFFKLQSPKVDKRVHTLRDRHYACVLLRELEDNPCGIHQTNVWRLLFCGVNCTVRCI